MVYEKNLYYAKLEEREEILALMAWLAEENRLEDIKNLKKNQIF